MKRLISLLSIFSLAIASPIFPRQQRLCNANPDTCDRKYTNVSYVGTHNSAFVGDKEDPRVNQELSVTGQLDAGIRFLQAQTHKDILGDLSMCHTSCLLYYAGSLQSYLSTINDWLVAHPTTQISLLLTNGDNVDISMFDAAFKSVGLDKLAFVPSTSPNQLAYDDWPTIGELIDTGKRLVVFLDYGAAENKVPYILNQYKYFFETPFDMTDASFNTCAINRPPGSSPDGKMMLVNHFLDKEVLGSNDVLVPDWEMNFQTNAAQGPGEYWEPVSAVRADVWTATEFCALGYVQPW